MKAAPYRFYRHCTIDEDGIMLVMLEVAVN